MMNTLNNPSSPNSSPADSSSTTTRTSTTTTQSSNTPAKRPTKFNWKIVLGVIILVLVAVGGAAGFYLVQTGNLDLRQQAAVTGGGGGDACSQGTAEGQCFSGLKCVNRQLVSSNDCKRSCNTSVGLLSHGESRDGACSGNGQRSVITCNDGTPSTTNKADTSCNTVPQCPSGYAQPQPNCTSTQYQETLNLGSNVFCHKCTPKPTVAAGSRCLNGGGCICKGSPINNNVICPADNPTVACYDKNNNCVLKNDVAGTTCNGTQYFNTKAQCDAGSTDQANCYVLDQGCGLRTINGIAQCNEDTNFATQQACQNKQAATGQISCWTIGSGSTCVQNSYTGSSCASVLLEGQASGEFESSVRLFSSAGECAAASSGGGTGGSTSSCLTTANTGLNGEQVDLLQEQVEQACKSNPLNNWNETNCTCSSTSGDNIQQNCANQLGGNLQRIVAVAACETESLFSAHWDDVTCSCRDDGQRSFASCNTLCTDKDGCNCGITCSNRVTDGKNDAGQDIFKPGTVSFGQSCPNYADEDRCRLGSDNYNDTLRACACDNGKTVPIGFKCSAPCEDGFGNNIEGMVSCAPDGSIRRCFNGTWDNIAGDGGTKYGNCGGTGIDDCAPTSERDCALGKEPGDRCGAGGICKDRDIYGPGFFSSEDGQSYYANDGVSLAQKKCYCDDGKTTTIDTPDTGTPGGGGGETPTYSCGSSCTSDSQCQSGDASLTCISGTCQNPSYPGAPNCQPPTGPMCLNIGMKDAQGAPITKPTIGQSVNFECGAVSGADHYIFRVIEPDGTIVDLTANGRNSSAFAVEAAGTYRAQCQICTGADASTCHSYEPLN